MRRFICSSKRLLMFFLLVIYLVNISVAQSEDFILNQGQKDARICPGTTTLFSTEIINSGSSESQYTITISGSASKWALSVPSGFILKPGERKTVYTYVTPKSSTPAGSYGLDLSVSTAKGLVKKVSYTVNVKDCYGVSITSEASRQICPCELAKYDFIVSNTGEFQETYSISVSGSAASYVKLSENSVTIPAGSSKTIFAYVQNLCTVGSDEFTVTATGREIASATSIVEVNACFDYSISSQKDFVNICDHSSEIMPMTISNDGSKSNQYALSIDGPSWANLEKTSLVLGSGQSSSVNLILNPDYNEVGSFSVNFKAVSQLGEIEAIKPLTVNVRECNDVLIELKEENDKICAGLEKNYQAIIKNAGEAGNDYRISIAGPEWSGIDKQLVSLDGGEQASLNIKLDPNADVNVRKESIEIIAETVDGRISSKDSLNVEIVSSNDCFKPRLSLEDESLDINIESSATIPITIENSGVEDASYEVAVSGDAASFSQLNPSSLRLNAGDSEIVYLYVAPTEDVREGAYKASVTVKLSDSAVLDTKTISINVLPGTETTEEATSIVEIVELEDNKSKEGNETGLEPVTGEAVSVGEKAYAYRWYIVAAFIILIVVIWAIRMRERKVPIEQWEREIEDNSYKNNSYPGVSKRAWRWIAGFVAVLVLFILGWVYADAIRTYIYYIIGGIILLIAILLLIKYKDAIIKFFEEEPENKAIQPKPQSETQIPAMQQAAKTEHKEGEHKTAEHKPSEKTTTIKEEKKNSLKKTSEKGKKSDEELYY